MGQDSKAAWSWRPISFQNLIFEGNAFRIILCKARISGLLTSKHLEMVGVSNVLAGVDIDKNSHRSLWSLRLPRWGSLRSELNTRSTDLIQTNAKDAELEPALETIENALRAEMIEAE